MPCFVSIHPRVKGITLVKSGLPNANSNLLNSLSFQLQNTASCLISFLLSSSSTNNTHQSSSVSTVEAEKLNGDLDGGGLGGHGSGHGPHRHHSNGSGSEHLEVWCCCVYELNCVDMYTGGGKRSAPFFGLGQWACTLGGMRILQHDLPLQAPNMWYRLGGIPTRQIRVRLAKLRNFKSYHRAQGEQDAKY